MAAGLLYSVRPELPFEVSIVLGALLIPLLLAAQKRLREPAVIESAAPAEPALLQ